MAVAGKREPQGSLRNMGKQEFDRTDGMEDRLVLISQGAGKVLILANICREKDRNSSTNCPTGSSIFDQQRLER